ncbi:hypothetical protein AK812_SmicGene28924 [Symbiodinium microadriaticum]|uniref:Uncharacterized protein n=1 Tax=Symbiodinium microadriaticum TaxID=2951 RepID=A0A1Q9D383_SYMMI|nr:hypothetical protein AK812_SmicGene28924 [Symbiodinium microadriaticum]
MRRVRFRRQNYNPVLSLLPALDGKKNGTLFTCVDRLKQYDEEYAIYLECPTNMPSMRCADGRYPTMLIESARDLQAMQKVVSGERPCPSVFMVPPGDVPAKGTMIYTENIEMFTSLTVEFAFDYAGNIAGSVQMISYRDLVHSASVVSLHTKSGPISPGGITDLFLIQRCTMPQAYMSHEFESLLQTFLNSHGLNEEVYEEVEWLETHRLASYIMLYVQFLQAVLYFSAHPRVAMCFGWLTRTVKKALWNMVHFFVEIGGHGDGDDDDDDDDDDYDDDDASGDSDGGYDDTDDDIQFIFVDGAEKLSGSMSAMYWVYAASFMLVDAWILEVLE